MAHNDKVAESRKAKIKKISKSVGRVFDERGDIKVVNEFGEVNGFDTTVGKYCRRRR